MPSECGNGTRPSTAMRPVVLDVADAARDVGARETPGELLVEGRPAPGMAEPVQQESRVRPLAERIGELAPEVRAGIAVDRDVGDVPELDARLGKAIADRELRKARPMLDPPEPLLLRRRHQHAIPEDAGGRIRVIGVDAEYVHPCAPSRGGAP